MRTFVALELPDPFVDQAAEIARCLSEHIQGRFMKRTGYHLTLAFIGELGTANVPAAIDALEAACADCGPIPIRSDGLGKFGRSHDATLWLGIAPDPLLTQLAERVREELDAHSMPFDTKAFKPHLTLARRCLIPKGTLPALAFPEPGEAHAVTLFKSTLTPEGALYKPLYSVELESCAPADGDRTAKENRATNAPRAHDGLRDNAESHRR